MDKDFVKPVKKTRLSEEIVGQIKDLIIQERLKPSDRLPAERELAKMFNVGRPTIREATRTLAQIGLIEVGSGQRGTTVRNFAQDPYMDSFKEQIDWMIKTRKVSIAQLTEFRDAFERRLALLAAERATTEELKEMQTLVEEMKVRTGDVRGYLEKAISFHKAMARATKNPMFHAIWSAFSDFILVHYEAVLEFSNRNAVRKLYLTNAEIYKALLSKNPDRIRSAVDENLKINRQISAVKVNKGKGS
jgi:GntR family transcriptional regulator, transcriptional repressor for pyruvate dehydrogenase complex